MEKGHGLMLESCRAMTHTPVVSKRTTHLGAEKNLSEG